MGARLVLQDEPGAWITFSSRGCELRARMDPIWLGPDKLEHLPYRPFAVLDLLDGQSRLEAMLADPMGAGIIGLLEDYLTAVGLGLDGVVMLVHALKNLDLFEIDLLHIGLDIRDWLVPEGSLSSRRVALIVQDCLDRPETRLGAKRAEVLPATKEALVAAQIFTSLVGKEGFVHRFLKSPDEIEHEREQARIAAEKRERIKDLRPVELATDDSSGSFESSTRESRRMLEAIVAAQGGDKE